MIEKLEVHGYEHKNKNDILAEIRNDMLFYSYKAVGIFNKAELDGRKLTADEDKVISKYNHYLDILEKYQSLIENIN